MAMHRAKARGLAVLFGVTLLAGGCTQRSSRTADTAPPPGDVPADINQPYRDNPDVGHFIERFETESREIYRCRGQILADLRLRPGMEVADIGAGTGLFTILFGKAVGKDGRVYAVDIAPEFLTYIEQRARVAQLDNVTTVLCPEDSVNLPEGSIDLAFVCDTYHHFAYPERSLASIHRALRPGGELIIIEFERIEGESSAWTLEHVRAGRETFVAEIEAAGFALVGDAATAPCLSENYFLRFTRVSTQTPAADK